MNFFPECIYTIKGVAAFVSLLSFNQRALISQTLLTLSWSLPLVTLNLTQRKVRTKDKRYLDMIAP